MDVRATNMSAWLEKVLVNLGRPGRFIIEPVTSDASFRRYFRIRIVNSEETYIVMDAPSENEDCKPFIKISAAMADAGLSVPRVVDQDIAEGFLLLTDFGDQQYLGLLNEGSVDQLYEDALKSLLILQKAVPSNNLLPDYTEKLLLAEMNIFIDWYLVGHLQLDITTESQALLDSVFSKLATQAMKQPRVWVHRDYHSRNLMIINDEITSSFHCDAVCRNPGILDFQDSVMGPICYDLVSLLKDCYISWPEDKINKWLAQYYAELIKNGLINSDISYDEFVYWFDFMGLQRHLKAIGIFSRLYLRDNKPGYLKDIPRTLSYVLQVSEKYSELSLFNEWLRCNVIPVASRGLTDF